MNSAKAWTIAGSVSEVISVGLMLWLYTEPPKSVVTSALIGTISLLALGVAVAPAGYVAFVRKRTAAIALFAGGIAVVTGLVGVWVGSTGRPIPVIRTLTDRLSVGLHYVLFDQFGGDGLPDNSQWSYFTVGDREGCNWRRSDGYAWVACSGTKTAQRAYYPYWDRDKAVRGVAMSGAVLGSNRKSWLELMVSFTANGAEEEEPHRAYYLSLQREHARVVECYPQEGWDCHELAAVNVEPLERHILKVEYESGELSFLVDSKLIDLKVQHSLPRNSMWRRWAIQAAAEPDGDAECATLTGYVDWVMIRP